MDSDFVGSILMGLICLIPFAFGLLLFGAFAFFIFWVIRTQMRPKSIATLNEERAEIESQVSRERAQLRPWTSESLTDLSTNWDATWTRLGRDSSAHGTIPALSDPEGPALVAFSLRVRGTRGDRGHMLASTSQHTFYYFMGTGKVRIDVDGVTFGNIQSDKTLLDVTGQAVGVAQRPGGEPIAVSIGTFGKVFDSRERAYDVVLGGRIVALMANPKAQLMNVISLGKHEYPPAVVLVENPSEEEATWLLALAILQVAGYNLLETIWTQPSMT